jgi:hypothetical protein
LALQVENPMPEPDVPQLVIPLPPLAGNEWWDDEFKVTF